MQSAQVASKISSRRAIGTRAKRIGKSLDGNRPSISVRRAIQLDDELL